MELVLLAALLELPLVLVDPLGRRGLVLVAEEPEDRGREVLGVIDGGHRLIRRELFLGLDDTATPAVDYRIEALQPTTGEKRLPASRARAEDADLAAHIRQCAEPGIGAVEVAEDSGVGSAARRPDFGPDVLGSAVAVAEVQVRRDRHEAVVGEAAGALAIPLVPSRRVVDDDHAGKRSGPEWPGHVRVDLFPVVPPHGHRFGDHAFVLIGLVRVSHNLPPCEVVDELLAPPGGPPAHLTSGTARWGA